MGLSIGKALQNWFIYLIILWYWHSILFLSLSILQNTSFFLKPALYILAVSRLLIWWSFRYTDDHPNAKCLLLTHLISAMQVLHYFVCIHAALSTFRIFYINCASWSTFFSQPSFSTILTSISLVLRCLIPRSFIACAVVIPAFYDTYL